jgi:hypothetical protein
MFGQEIRKWCLAFQQGGRNSENFDHPLFEGAQKYTASNSSQLSIHPQPIFSPRKGWMIPNLQVVIALVHFIYHYKNRKRRPHYEGNQPRRTV